MYFPVINAVPCLIIGGILLLQSERLVGHQASADNVSTIYKGLKISGGLFIIGSVGIWFHDTTVTLVGESLNLLLFPIYAAIFDHIHTDRFFNSDNIIFLQNILYCFFPILVFGLSLYLINVSDKLNELAASRSETAVLPQEGFHLFLKIFLIVLLTSHLAVLVIILSVLSPSELDGLSIAGILINAMFLMALFKRRRWGFYGYLFVNVLGFFTAAYSNLDSYYIGGLVLVLVLFTGLKIGGRNSGWKQLA